MAVSTSPISLSDLLHCLVACSEKAARIARIFREEDDLFRLLVEEKAEKEKNKRFVRDFKTLADVLVQETIRRDVGRQFPSLSSTIQGEEQNTFQNSLGESITVDLVEATEPDTVRLLGKVLDGRDHVASDLAAVVHSNTPCDTQYSSTVLLPADSVGVWIDPIDSTSEYIQAKNNATAEHGVQLYGLQCVCVLIGAYDLQTGVPILGVVNQPFYGRDSNHSRWEGRCYWAVHCGPEQAISDSLRPDTRQDQRIVVLSSSESPELQDIIASKYKVLHTAGSGYKSLLVACQKADLYVLSPGTTYFWDTCGPHVLLKAQGGGVVKFEDALSMSVEEAQVRYFLKEGDDGTESFRNAKGIIAYRCPDVLREFLQVVKENGYRSEEKK